jgi:prophage regulatory protein
MPETKERTKLFRLPKVLDEMGLSRASLYQRIQDGLFPEPVRPSRRMSVWPSYEVQAVIDAMVAGKTETSLRKIVKGLEAERAAS